jgi:hypothetical protein
VVNNKQLNNKYANVFRAQTTLCPQLQRSQCSCGYGKWVANIALPKGVTNGARPQEDFMEDYDDGLGQAHQQDLLRQQES